MSTFTDVKNRMAGTLREQGDQYAGGEERPLRGYLVTMTSYESLVGGLAAAAMATRRQIPNGFSVTDVVLCAAATHKLSRLLAEFDGPGPEGTEQMMGKIGMHPASRNAMAAGLTETVGGAMLALGLATPLAAASLIGVMITAIRKVHFSNGPWNAQAGYEYNLALIAALLGLADAGPGAVSADHVLGTEKTGAGWALAALGTGTLASVAAVELARRRAPSEDDARRQTVDNQEMATARA